MALADYDNETMRRDFEWSLYDQIDKDEQADRELAEQGLRRAAFHELGWYVPTSAGKIWATDEPKSDK